LMEGGHPRLILLLVHKREDKYVTNIMKKHSVVALLAALLLAGPLAVTALCPEFDEENLYPYPGLRYTVWDDLTPEAMEAAVHLGYGEDDWNLPGTAKIESLSYESIGLQGFFGFDGQSQQNAIQDICLTELTWDCYLNHYEDYSWDELAAEEVQVYFQTLGWTQASWESDDESGYPESED